MNTEAQLQLREQFYKETGMMWENSDDEPDIDYVEWLEAKVIAVQNDVIGNEALREALLNFCEHLNSYKGLEECRFSFMMQDYLDKIKQ